MPEIELSEYELKLIRLSLDYYAKMQPRSLVSITVQAENLSHKISNRLMEEKQGGN